MSQYQNMMEDSLFGPKSASVVENIFEKLMNKETDNINEENNSE